ncbi:D-isomer specific 2-hydroxyacid dehydrogenase [Xylariaceae sp. FL0255]|nr:D-isomer specific 2-hydroxyacid dehydrogenase [Xylariaceae sp. FL0255]
MAPTVLLIGPLLHTTEEWKSLGSKYNLLEFQEWSRDKFLSNCRDGTYDAVVGCFRNLSAKFDAEIIEALPKNWKFIAHHGAGYDNIDVDACSRRKIAVSHTPGAVDDGTADTGIFLLLGALRVAQASINRLRAGKFLSDSPMGHDPQGKILGILGMGGIGRAMASRARAFGMSIIYHNRRRLDPSLEQGAKYVSFDELLSTADVLSLNLALNASTRHIIGAKQLAQLKSGAVIVNTARGGLIDEGALVEALDSGHLSAVGLDVFEKEPEVHPGLIKNERAFLVPHIGTHTHESRRAMELLVLKNLEAAVDEGKMVTLVAEQKGLDWAPPLAKL